MFVPATSSRRTVLLVVAVLLSGLSGLIDGQPASARTTAPPASRLIAPHVLAPVEPTRNPPGLVYEGSTVPNHLFRTNLTGSVRRQLTFGKLDSSYPRWGPYGGHIVYARDYSDLMLIGANGRHNHLLRHFGHRLIDDIAVAPGGGRIALVLEPDNDAPDIYIYTPRTNTLQRLHITHTNRTPQTLDWSHDGRQLAFSAIDYNAPNTDSDLYTVAPDGSHLRRLTHTTNTHEDNPRWSPDDRRILFIRSDATDTSDCVMWVRSIASDGSDLRRVRAGCNVNIAAWSPNGRRIVVAKWNRSDDSAIWTMNLDGTKREFVRLGYLPSYRPLCKQAPCSP